MANQKSLRGMDYEQRKHEEILWRAYKQGDKKAFGAIYDRYIDALLSYGLHFCKEKALVEDAIQDLFVELWQSRANLSDTTSIKYYLFRSLQRKICYMKDKNVVFAEFTDKTEGRENPFEEQIVALEQAEEYHAILSKNLPILPKRQREAVHLRYYENLSTREIALRMDMNEQSVRNIIQRALQRLKTVFITILFLVFALAIQNTSLYSRRFSSAPVRNVSTSNIFPQKNELENQKHPFLVIENIVPLSYEL